MEVLLVGYGRMGRAIEALLKERCNHHAQCVNSSGRVTLGGEDGRSFRDLREVTAGYTFDLAFEFSVPTAAAANVEILLERGIPTVCGTTGWRPERAIRLANDRAIPFLWSANFSIGVAILRRLVHLATELCAPLGNFEPGILERHHGRKLDRPSGTAAMLAETIAAAAGCPAPEIASLRQGGAPGEHMVFFEGEAECLEIRHTARSRDIFARGACLAGEWLVRERPGGAVTMDDFLEGTHACTRT